MRTFWSTAFTQCAKAAHIEGRHNKQKITVTSWMFFRIKNPFDRFYQALSENYCGNWTKFVWGITKKRHNNNNKTHSSNMAENLMLDFAYFFKCRNNFQKLHAGTYFQTVRIVGAGEVKSIMGVSQSFKVLCGSTNGCPLSVTAWSNNELTKNMNEDINR